MLKNVLLYSLLSCVGMYAFSVNTAYAQTQTDINQSAANDYKKADANLNKVYRDVFNKLDATAKADLKAAQNAWIKYRDLDCKFQSAGVAGGSMQPMVVSGCLADKTAARTKELNGLLHCKEGDMTCITAQ